MTQHSPAAPSADDSHIAESGISLRDVLDILLRRWLPIVLLAVAGVAVAALATSLQPRLYTATATAVVNPAVTDNPAAALSQDTLAKSRAVQFNELAQSSIVADRATTMVGFPLSSSDALRAVTTKVPTQTSMIEVHATLDDPDRAATLATSWVDALIQESEELPQGGGGRPQVQIDSMLPATRPTDPSSPDLLFNVAVGGVLGLGLGLAIAALMELLDRRIRSTEDLQRAGVTPIGAIPKASGLADGQRVLAEAGRQDTGHFRAREAFNELRINLQYMNPDDPPRIITVTSTSPADGKSTVAANLAIALVRAGVPAVLVDADLRRPTVATTFGLPTGAGLSDVVVGRASFVDVLHESADPQGLVILPAGQLPPNPTELLTSARFKEAIEALAETHMVIVDAPPLLAVPDASVVATRLDGALLVLDAESTTRDELRHAVQALQRVHAPILGAVLNRVDSKDRSGRYAYYRSDYTSPASTP